jgi:thiamine transport system ATP-binding protein
MLHVERLSVAYGEHLAVRDLTLSAKDGEVVCVLGPSGCGKSTLLRAIAGLEPTLAGTIELDGVTLDGKRPDQRGIGLMFQDHALFPHRTVGENVAFGPRMRGVERSVITVRVGEALALVDLAGTEDRRITQLSGGEQQRVALARAIAPRPRLLMLDEPLGSLDRALRERLLELLPQVFTELGTTVLYVTHDQDEALALADRVAVMRAGRLEQEGVPDQLWGAPETEFVARFIGFEHVLEAQVTDGIADTPLGQLPVAVPDGATTLVLLPDALRITDPRRPLHVRGEVALSAVVVGRRFAGDHVRVQTRTDGGTLLTVPVWRGVGPEVGEPVELALDASRIRTVGTDEGAT